MLNRDKLKGAVMGNGKTMEDLAKQLGITYVTLNRKMNGASDFTRNEIQITRDFLKLTDDEIKAIFFA